MGLVAHTNELGIFLIQTFSPWLIHNFFPQFFIEYILVRLNPRVLSTQGTLNKIDCFLLLCTTHLFASP